MPPYIDLTGEKFTRLLVVSDVGRGPRGSVLWLCNCDCGSSIIVDGASLRRGATHSCGCLNREYSSYRGRKNITGQRFGRLLVTGFSHIDSHRSLYWKVKCDCGKEKLVRGSTLRRGTQISCGCYKDEIHAKALTTHGLSKTKEYRANIARRREERSRKCDSEWTIEMEHVLRIMFPRCVVCGISLPDHIEQKGKILCVDHVLPLSKGNGLRPGNATILCFKCNQAKHTKDLSLLPPDMRDKILISAAVFHQEWNRLHSDQGSLECFR
jgi:5-methylcytosine-specific restriction endonuclease McrA